MFFDWSKEKSEVCLGVRAPDSEGKQRENIIRTHRRPKTKSHKSVINKLKTYFSDMEIEKLIVHRNHCPMKTDERKCAMKKNFDIALIRLKEQ